MSAAGGPVSDMAADRPTSRRFGERAVLIEFETNAAVQQAFRHARARQHELELADVIPGHTTLVLVGASRRPNADDVLGAANDSAASQPDGREHELAVAYDGPDIRAVAEACGLSPEEVVRRHQAAHYRVAFLGFAPGFAYLTDGDPALRLPRRAEPRSRVPAGSLALAEEYSTVYPTASPGGWHLLGRCTERLFDVHTDPPARLQPGDRVRFLVS